MNTRAIESRPAGFIERLRMRLWAWRLRHLRCTRCGSKPDAIRFVTDQTHYMLGVEAHCPACDHWDDWRSEP